jgi:hypothetical protein
MAGRQYFFGHQDNNNVHRFAPREESLTTNTNNTKMVSFSENWGGGSSLLTTDDAGCAEKMQMHFAQPLFSSVGVGLGW